MRALVYHGPGHKAFQEAPDPELHLEEQWIRDITITTGLVDTSSAPTLMRLITTGQIDAKRFITHHFGLDEFAEAYDVFARAADTNALKVVLSRPKE